ncbi:hypothetical protein GTW50_30655 [Streptomyces sp. SID7815]|uniref:Uncharacterized protein n=1 Tax=Streptomyces pratensis (strain ATCC 33331 / IAF-45CD) TaxID=591167 RepID=A0A8D4BDX8_STRFA|nr:hypothetical protein [Streptomyces sp. SID7815]MYT54833.1 hypothetical protein [Streptomyces sp. SID7815]
MGLILLVLFIALAWFLLALLPLPRPTPRLVFTTAHLAATVALTVAADRSSPGQPALWVLLFGPGGLTSLTRLCGAVAGGVRTRRAKDAPPED